MKRELKAVGVLSCGKISGVVNAIMGVVIGSFLAIISALGLMFEGPSGAPNLPGFIVGIGSIVFMPFFYGIFGFIFGIIGAFIYNLTASFFGGLEYEVRDVSSLPGDVVAPAGPTVSS